MNKKRYILMTIEKSNYDGYERYFYRLFSTYRELQNHLLKFSDISKKFIIFEETSNKYDKSFIVESDRQLAKFL